ncbi:MAG: 3-hydroxyacyl-CoA dehydrogenase NAD-binding domain-containing protein [Hyphomicrobiaceae bacterium]
MAKAKDKIAVLGAGLIGAGWAARLSYAGHEVALYDTSASVEGRAREVIDRGHKALSDLAGSRTPAPIRFTTDLNAAIAGAAFVQEAAPEREDVKRKLFTAVSKALPADIVIASSSSAFLPTRLQEGMTHPERILIGHPFNPVYLIPLCEIVGGKATSAAAMSKAKALYDSVGMHSLVMDKEIDAYIANRLQEAVWTESLHLIDQGIATAGQIDDAVAFGPGLRWAFMGAFVTSHLAGGAGGMRYFVEHFGPSLANPNCFMKPPKITPELIEKIASQTEAKVGAQPVAEMEAVRDRALVAVMKALAEVGIGAGETVKAFKRS